jgi:glycosyltransferase involved in cell wall biosynthesis
MSVSVIIPNYNRCNLLIRALNSVFTQLKYVSDIIVIDDASSDNSIAQLMRLQTSCKKLVILKNNSRKGAQYSRLRGILSSNSDYLVFLDSDDVLTKFSIKDRLKVADKDPMIGLVYGDQFSEGKIHKWKSLDGFSFNYLIKHLSLCDYSSMLIRRSCFQTTGYPSPEFPAWQDDDMVLTIGKYFKVSHCGKVVAESYKQVDSISNSSKNLYNGCMFMLNKYSKDIFINHGFTGIYFWLLRLLRIRLNLVYEYQINKNNTSLRFIKIINFIIFKIEKRINSYFEYVYA